MASPSGTGGIRLERLNRCYECEVAFPEPVPVEQAMDDFGDYLDGVGYLCSACADEFDGPAERGPSGTGHDTAGWVGLQRPTRVAHVPADPPVAVPGPASEPICPGLIRYAEAAKSDTKQGHRPEGAIEGYDQRRESFATAVNVARAVLAGEEDAE